MILKIKGRELEPGLVVAIAGERGRFKFQYATWSADGKLSLTFVGGVPGHECYRSFYPERVKRVL